jgi:hypothetical protein
MPPAHLVLPPVWRLFSAIAKRALCAIALGGALPITMQADSKKEHSMITLCFLAIALLQIDRK